MKNDLCEELIVLSERVGLDQSSLASLIGLTQPYLNLLVHDKRSLTTRLIRLFEEAIGFLQNQIEINETIHQKLNEDLSTFAKRKQAFLQHIKYKFNLIPWTD